MPLSRLRKYLDKNSISYTLVSRPPVFTFQGTTVIVHAPGRQVAKTVMVKIDGELALTVLPAASHVDISAFRHEAGVRSAEFATDEEFRDRFPECEIGTMPPFGDLHGLEVFADETLSRNEEITFNARSHRELIQMPWNDFERVVKPTVIRLAARPRAAAVSWAE